MELQLHVNLDVKSEQEAKEIANYLVKTAKHISSIRSAQLIDEEGEDALEVDLAEPLRRIAIGRPINGITINGNEFLVDENKERMLFMNIEFAKEFLISQGVNEEGLESFDFVDIYE